jgi:hypothetical protein
MNTTKTLLDHEKLIAYQRSIQFVTWSSPLLEKLLPFVPTGQNMNNRGRQPTGWRKIAFDPAGVEQSFTRLPWVSPTAIQVEPLRGWK